MEKPKNSLFKIYNKVCTHLTLEDECSSCIATPSELSLDAACASEQHAFGSDSTKKKKRERRHKVPSAARKKAKACIDQEQEQRKRWGYSVTLMLHDDPWKIKKVLQESDLGNMCRLLLPKELAENLVMPVLGDDARINVESEEGVDVSILDVDTNSIYNLVFKKWGSSRSYVFIGNWVKDFVNRRGLKKGDEIGFHWDPYKNCFNFTVFN